jgi:signal peptidase II
MMKQFPKIALFCVTSFAFIGCDRVTKDLAKEYLMFSEPLSYFHDTIRLLYVENTGAAMSLGANLPQPYNFLLLSMLPVVFLTALTVYTLRQLSEMSMPKIFCFAMVIAGGIGNIIDRIFNDRHVPDFLNIGFQDIRTGIFNVADMCVTFGVVGLLYYLNKDKSE